MKILMVMDPGILVPPKTYGGIERIVEILAIEYNRMGHEVYLLVTPGSYVDGCKVYPFGKEGFPPKKKDALKAITVAWQFLWKKRNDFDLVHNFGRLAYLLPILNHKVKKIMSYQREIDNKNISLINKLPNRNMFFTACSADLLSRTEEKGQWEAVYNTINFSKYNLQQNIDADAPIMFLGRLERIKGCHTAIELARKTGHRLIIAGNISTLPEEIDYFEKEVKPHIDGEQVVYTGALNDEQKNYWLGKSKALIFPIEWNEPFGIVMIEAMACGTPVIAYNIGSVKEVIDEGITGYKINNMDEMVAAVKKVTSINRQHCREHAGKRFDASVVAKKYLDFIQPSGRSALIVTTGQPAANPRVIKEYEALKNAGYQVKVLYTYSAEWSYKIDELKFKCGELEKSDFNLVGGNPHNKKTVYLFSRIFFKLCSYIARGIPVFFLKDITFVRSSFFLWSVIKKYKADIYIAHYLGALPAAIRASKKYKAAVIFDAEDFHRGQETYYPGQVKDVIEIENRLLPKVNLITTASPLISGRYQQLYARNKVITINNVFSINYLQPLSNGEVQNLKLFWFSQNIGPNRGLEVIIEALNLIEEDITLTLLGNIRNKEFVQALIEQSRRPDRIQIMEPVSPEEIFSVAAKFDIGFASEIPHCLNRDICLTNKIFTYLLAGNCILASDTSSQKDFMIAHPKVGFLYKFNDPHQLASRIRQLFYDRVLLANCKSSAQELATSEFNWEKESEKLIEEVINLLKIHTG